ncbi:MAG TPA: 4-(cytidine 5'-diphospho)-2-C-methyl-D-erythritol kinase [Opitutaceae bacterium]
MSALSLPSPAKVNLFLAITGRRPDGYHDLVSVAAPLDWGDTLTVEERGGSFTIDCDVRGIPTDESNLVIKAAKAFAAETGWKGGARFGLTKRIPAGAGLGGASSNAVAALRALNGLAGKPLEDTALARLASGIGSDCALFFPGQPVVMRGRGERVELLAGPAADRLRGTRIVVFKPAFAISTTWAYARLAENPSNYLAAVEAEDRLAAWAAPAGGDAGRLLFNSMEKPAFAKFPALPLLLATVRERFGVAAGMSGSGSACFALPADGVNSDPIAEAVREAWGPSALFVDTRIARGG